MPVVLPIEKAAAMAGVPVVLVVAMVETAMERLQRRSDGGQRGARRNRHVTVGRSVEDNKASRQAGARTQHSGCVRGICLEHEPRTTPLRWELLPPFHRVFSSPFHSIRADSGSALRKITSDRRRSTTDGWPVRTSLVLHATVFGGVLDFRLKQRVNVR